MTYVPQRNLQQLNALQNVLKTLLFRRLLNDSIFLVPSF